MYRMMATDGSERQSRFLRWGGFAAYLMLGTAGVLFLKSPELVNAFEKSGVAMATFMAVGGYLAAIGALSRRWVGEFLGLPLLATSLAVLGFESFENSFLAYPWLSSGNLALMLALSLLLVVRWRAVLAIYRFVLAVAQADKGEA